MVAPGKADHKEHQMRSLQAAGHMGGVLARDADFIAMGCDNVIYASLSGDQVFFLCWADADAYSKRKHCYAFYLRLHTGNVTHADLDLASDARARRQDWSSP